MMDKHEIRKAVKAVKKLLTAEQRTEAAARALAVVEALPQFAAATNVLVYHSLPDELSTIAFIERWAERKRLLLPRVNGDDLDVLEYNPQQLHTGAFNIQEPTGGVLFDPERIELVIVPAVAYDRHGNRIGRGKGYYDRLLRRTPQALKVGVAYQCQICDDFTPDEFDIPVDIVITDQGIIKPL